MNICCLFARKSILYVGNVGYSRGVYPVLCGLSFTVLWSLYIYMFIYTTSELRESGFIAAVRAIFTSEKVEFSELPELDTWFFPVSLDEFLQDAKYFDTEMDIEYGKDYFQESAWVFSDEHILELREAYCEGVGAFLEDFYRILRDYEKEIQEESELFIAVVVKIITA